MDAESSFANLRRLASRTGLPAAWLKAEADAGRIPCLRVGRSLKFNVEAVERVLAERAAQTPPAEIKVSKDALIGAETNTSKGVLIGAEVSHGTR
jgi:hypothetical protein